MIAQELADLVGVSEATVSRLLSGDRRPSVETMMKIKTVLGWSVDDQANALAHPLGPRYGEVLRLKMENADAPGSEVNPDVPPVRGMRTAGSGGDWVPALEARFPLGQEGGQC